MNQKSWSKNAPDLEWCCYDTEWHVDAYDTVLTRVNYRNEKRETKNEKKKKKREHNEGQRVKEDTKTEKEAVRIGVET